MRINPITVNHPTLNTKRSFTKKSQKEVSIVASQNTLPNYQVSFGNKPPVKITPERIENFLEKKYGMTAKFNDNLLVATCTVLTAGLYEKLFGKESLPNEVYFTSLRPLLGGDPDSDKTLGIHTRNQQTGTNTIIFNASSNCFYSYKDLIKNELAGKAHKFHPTSHFLQTFVHEFAHSAHYKNLRSLDKVEVMDKLRESELPGIFAKFVAKFNLGAYSTDNMNEFMAERITKDICSNLDENHNYTGDIFDLDYAHIFSHRWKDAYISPQALLDYLTQQTWNGKAENAEGALKTVKVYLAKVEAVEEPIFNYHTTLENIYAELEDVEGFNKKIRAKFSGDYRPFMFYVERAKKLFETCFLIQGKKRELVRMYKEVLETAKSKEKENPNFFDNHIYSFAMQNLEAINKEYEEIAVLLKNNYNFHYLYESRDFKTSLIKEGVLIGNLMEAALETKKEVAKETAKETSKETSKEAVKTTTNVHSAKKTFLKKVIDTFEILLGISYSEELLKEKYENRKPVRKL